MVDESVQWEAPTWLLTTSCVLLTRSKRGWDAQGYAHLND